MLVYVATLVSQSPLMDPAKSASTSQLCHTLGNEKAYTVKGGGYFNARQFYFSFLEFLEDPEAKRRTKKLLAYFDKYVCD
jgi:hypothetical protein